MRHHGLLKVQAVAPWARAFMLKVECIRWSPGTIRDPRCVCLTWLAASLDLMSATPNGESDLGSHAAVPKRDHVDGNPGDGPVHSAPAIAEYQRSRRRYMRPALVGLLTLVVAGILRRWEAVALAVVIVGFGVSLVLVSLNYRVARRADLRLAAERMQWHGRDE